MAKFYGAVGFAKTTENNGVWTETITDHNYTGDIIRNVRRLEPGESINDNPVVSNTISIIADPFANQNFHAIRYVKWMGASWKVTSVEVQRPRLLLTIGGIYNG